MRNENQGKTDRSKEIKEESVCKEVPVLISFQKIFETICEEPVNRYYTKSILLAVSDAITATDIHYAAEIYKKSLTEYMGSKKGEYYFLKTKNNLESIFSYFKEEINDKK